MKLIVCALFFSLSCGGGVRGMPTDAMLAPDVADAGFDVADAGFDALDTQDLRPDAQDGPTASATPDAPPADRPEVSPGFLQVKLVGRSEHAGTVVAFVGTGVTAMTDISGGFTVPQLRDGRYAVTLRNGPYEDDIPELIVKGGSPFALFQGGEGAVSMVEVQRGRRLVDGWIDSTPIAVSPRGDRLLVPTGRAQLPVGLVLLDSTGRTPTQIARDVLLTQWGFRDDSSVFFMRGERGLEQPADLMTVPISGGEPTTWFSSVVRGTPPLFVLGGSRVLVHKWAARPRAPQLTLADLDGRNPVALGEGAQALTFSPDGFWLAFDTSADPTGLAREFKLVDLRTGQMRMVANDARLSTEQLSFTPDNRRLLFLTEVLGDVRSYSMADGVAVTLGHAESLVRSPDGRFVVVQTTPGGPLMVVGTEGAPKREVPFSAGYGGSLSLTRFTRDSRYYIVGNAVFNTETGVGQRINFNLQTEIHGYIEATRTVIYSGSTGVTSTRQLSTFALEGAANPVVVTERLLDAFLSPSGAHLWYSERKLPNAQPRLTVVDLTSGKSHAFAPGIGRPQFAPDESKVAFLDGDGNLMVGDLRTDAAVVVAASVSGLPQIHGFSPDGSHLLFSDLGLTKVAPSDGSGATTIARRAIAPIWHGDRRVSFGLDATSDRPLYITGRYLAPVP